MTPHESEDEDLDVLQSCALMWGLLDESDRAAPAAAKALIDRAVLRGERLVHGDNLSPASMTPEVQFELGGAYFKRGDRAAAARAFLEIVRRFPEHDRALRSASLSAQLAADAVRDAQGEATAEELYADALRLLIK